MKRWQGYRWTDLWLLSAIALLGCIYLLPGMQEASALSLKDWQRASLEVRTILCLVIILSSLAGAMVANTCGTKRAWERKRVGFLALPLIVLLWFGAYLSVPAAVHQCFHWEKVEYARHSPSGEGEITIELGKLYAYAELFVANTEGGGSVSGFRDDKMTGIEHSDKASDPEASRK